MATRRIQVDIVGDASQLERTFKKAGRSAVGFNATLAATSRSSGAFVRGAASMSGALSKFGGVLALTSGSFFAGAGLIAGVGGAVKAAATLEQTLNVLAAVSGATATQMKAVADEASALGADINLPKTSATDAAVAMTELAKGGLSVEQAMKAARGTLQLAAAANTDVTTAANISARALAAFNLSGDQAGAIADALAGAANAATGDINDFAIALAQSATIAHNFGLSAQDTTAILAELAKAGLVGSDAGTSLRVMLTRLLPVSKAAQREMARLGVSVQDVNGNFLPARTVILEYKEALDKLTPAQRQHALQVIFGTDAQRAANIILGSGVKNFDHFRKAVDSSGQASQLAAARNKGLIGAVDSLGSAAQTAGVQLGNRLLGPLTKYARLAAKLTGSKATLNFLGTATGTSVADDLQKKFEAIDWGKVGKRVGDGIQKGVSEAFLAGKSISDRLQEVFKSIDFNALGRAAGPGIAAALVSAFATLLDPGFWIKNWDLALAIAISVFPVGRLGKFLTAPFRKIGLKLGAELGLAVGVQVERLGGFIASKAGRLGADAVKAIETKFSDLGVRLAEGIQNFPAAILAKIQRPFERALASIQRRFGKPVALLVKVLGIEFVIHQVASVVSYITDKVKAPFSFVFKLAGLGLATAAVKTWINLIKALITGGFRGLFNQLKIEAVRAALAILEPFTHLPASIAGIPIPGIKGLQGLKRDLTEKLAELQPVAKNAGAAIGQTTGEAIVGSLQTALAGAKAVVAAALAQAGPAPKGIAGRDFSAGFAPDIAPATFKGGQGSAAARAQAVTNRNTFFDNAITRITTRAGLGTLRQQLAGIQQASALLQKRLAATKDVTRRLNLEDQILQLASQANDIRKQLGDEFLASLQFGLTKAQATASFADDFKALAALKAGILAQIKATGETQDLQQQLFDVQQQIIQARKDQKQARIDRATTEGFLTLGLTATGDVKTPLLPNLRKRLGTITESVKGTFLDTPKTAALLKRIRKELEKGFVPKDVRAKVKEMFDEIHDELKNGSGNLTKFAHTNSTAILAGLGLSPEQIRALQSRLSAVGAGGTVPGSHSIAFAGGSTVVHTTVTLDGKVVATNTTKHQQKASTQRSVPRRGSYAGRH